VDCYGIGGNGLSEFVEELRAAIALAEGGA
jgi:hypothetical protein